MTAKYLDRLTENDMHAGGPRFQQIVDGITEHGVAGFNVYGHELIYSIAKSEQSCIAQVQVGGRQIELGTFEDDEVSAVRVMAAHLNDAFKQPAGSDLRPRGRPQRQRTEQETEPTSPKPTERGQPMGGKPRDPRIAAPGEQLRKKHGFQTTANTKAPMGLQSKFDPPILKNRRADAMGEKDKRIKALEGEVRDLLDAQVTQAEQHASAMERIQALEAAAQGSGTIDNIDLTEPGTVEQPAKEEDTDEDGGHGESTPVVEKPAIHEGDLVQFPRDPFDAPRRVIEIAPKPTPDGTFEYAVLEDEDDLIPILLLELVSRAEDAEKVDSDAGVDAD